MTTTNKDSNIWGLLRKHGMEPASELWDPGSTPSWVTASSASVSFNPSTIK